MALKQFMKRNLAPPAPAADAIPIPGAGVIDKEKVDPEHPPQYGQDLESQVPPGRRLSRIDGKLEKDATGGIGGSDSDSNLSIGAQMELEKDNAIKYRTCGWKKVCSLG